MYRYYLQCTYALKLAKCAKSICRFAQKRMNKQILIKERDVDWNGFKVFLAVARAGSLSGAAKQLSVNHSTVFRRLNALEEEMGGRLFERFQHSYQLTALGEEVQTLAKAIENSFNDIERHVVGKDIQPKGRVSLTAPNNIAYHYLPGYLDDFKQMYPDIQVDLIVSNYDFNLDSREADIAIRASSKPPEHLVGKQIASIAWSVFASPQYLNAHQTPKNFNELHQHTLIGACEFLTKLAPFKLMETSFLSQIHVRSNDLVSMSYLAQAGQGLAFLPNDQARPGLIKLFDLGSEMTSQLWLLTHPDLRKLARVKLLMRYLSDCFEKEKRLLD